jgi:uncharacterized membrane protein YoaK (UPF0700 family)
VFKHEGPSRSPRNNAILAAYLALTAGFVNSSGFALLGTVTSHVTGNVTRFADDVARGSLGTGLDALGLVLAFFAGAFAASMVIEGLRKRSGVAYGIALVLEAAALIAFLVDERAAILCFAMGAQNSLVTRLSGAVIRTTHLTGVVTDLGIEAARFIVERARGIGTVSDGRPGLLAIIVTSFTAGAVAGAFATVALGPYAMIIPTGAVVVAAGYAFLDGIGRRIDGTPV